MKINHPGTAGTLESSDIQITLAPAADGITIQLQSSVEKQFGEQIRAVIKATLAKLAIENVAVEANDKGALDCTIKARTIAAAYRAAENKTFDWEEINAWIN